MTQAEGKELEDGEKTDPFSDQIVEGVDDELHHENERDDRETEEIGADVVRENITVERSNFHGLKRLSPAMLEQE
jgi:hypothetical protein